MTGALLPWLPSTVQADADEAGGRIAALDPRAGMGDRASPLLATPPPTEARPAPDHAQLLAASRLWQEAVRRFREQALQRHTPPADAGAAGRRSYQLSADSFAQEAAETTGSAES